MKLPGVAALEVTYRCNHRCLFCSCPWEADDAYKSAELDHVEWCNVIDILHKNGVHTVSFTGGEPLLRDDLFRLIDHALLSGLRVALISNGRSMDEAFLAAAAERQLSLSISLPGIRTYRAHTGVDGANHVLALCRAAERFGIPCTANIAVTKLNLPELYENIALPLINGASYVLLNRFMPGGRGLSNRAYLLSNHEINEMLDIAEAVLTKAGRRGHVGTELPLCVVETPERYQRLAVSYRCAAAKDFFVIDPSGWLKVCNHSPVRICRWNGLEKLDWHPYWRRFAERASYPEMCSTCVNRAVCDGGCREAAHVATGNIIAPDPCFTE